MTTVEDVIRIFGQPPTVEETRQMDRRLAEAFVDQAMSEVGIVRVDPPEDWFLEQLKAIELDYDDEAPEPGSWLRNGF